MSATPEPPRSGRLGRPRSEQAREAVLHAVDDLLVEVGYAAMTMKGIAQRAGVSRQTVYRWWSTKAEILLEASAADAREELSIEPTGDPRTDVTAYLDGLIGFLVASPAGAAYRALLGEAQHAPAVAELIGARDVLGDSARAILEPLGDPLPGGLTAADATALLTGPVVVAVLTGRDPSALHARSLADAFLRAVAAPPAPRGRSRPPVPCRP